MEKLVYYERLSKGNQAGLRHLKVTPLTSEIIGQPDNPRCMVNLFKTYLSNIPDGGPLYIMASKKKDNNCHFSTKSCVGQNKLQKYLENMFRDVKIDTTGRNISGHSGRATVCSNLYNAGYEEKTIKSRSGHRSKAVQSYMRPNATTKKAVSDLLQAKRPDEQQQQQQQQPPPPPLQPVHHQLQQPDHQQQQQQQQQVQQAMQLVQSVGKGEIRLNNDGRICFVQCVK